MKFCVCARGLCKIGEVKGKGVKPGYRLHEPGWLTLQR